MLPITGPIYEVTTLPFGAISRDRYRQAMPVDRPLPYRYSWTYGVDVGWDYTGYSATVKNNSFALSSYPGVTRKTDAARNLCYSRLKSQLSDQAGWAENFAQYNKTRQGLVDRCVQLGHFAGALRQRRFGDAARILRTPLPSGVSHRKALSQNFLEYEYGIKPLISDIQSSWKILTSDPDPVRIEASAREGFSELTVVNNINPSSGASSTETVYGVVVVKMGCHVRIDNPDLFLASQLGIIDVALPWKLVPFSFVVDWFVNVEQCISSLTDWLGTEISSPWTLTFHRGGLRKTSYNYWNSGESWSRTSRDQNSVELLRQTVISGPTLQVRPFKGFSLERGAQAIALVLSVLGK